MVGANLVDVTSGDGVVADEAIAQWRLAVGRVDEEGVVADVAARGVVHWLLERPLDAVYAADVGELGRRRRASGGGGEDEMEGREIREHRIEVGCRAGFVAGLVRRDTVRCGRHDLRKKWARRG